MITPTYFTYFQASRDAFKTTKSKNRIKFYCVQCCSIGLIIELTANLLFDFVRLPNPIE